MKVYSLLKSVSKSKSRFVAVSVLALLFLSMFASLIVQNLLRLRELIIVMRIKL
jgi:hypothetical protein